MGLVLPAPLKTPAGRLPFAMARIVGARVLIAGHGPLNPRVRAWTRVFGMVNVAPGFNDTPSVINGFSDLILELYGPEVGAHARSAVGMAELPFN
ncbi:RidA family protein, partial [Roseiarcus sp.]|uniref:RidA family protein n=1 Tax=Roseiarcus sp. TaxID=1969460 RepID=UPI003C716979